MSFMMMGIDGWAVPASGGGSAIAFVNKAYLSFNVGTSFTASYTVGSGSNRLLVVGVVGDLTLDDVTGVTYNSVAMTQVGKVQTPTGGRWTYLYYLLNPASGSNNVVVSAGSSHFLGVGAADYTGVNSLNASVTNTASSSTTVTGTLTTSINNAWLMAAVGYTSGALSSSTPGSVRYDMDFNVGGYIDSNSAITPAGSTSITATQSLISNLCIIVGAFAP